MNLITERMQVRVPHWNVRPGQVYDLGGNGQRRRVVEMIEAGPVSALVEIEILEPENGEGLGI